MEKEKVRETEDYIFKDIVSSIGSEESSKVYMVTDKETGESKLVISKTITEHYPVTEYDNVIDLFDRLNCGSGRKSWKLNEIAHPYNPK